MPNPPKQDNKQKGDAFEDYVAYLYEGFGYAVQRDVLMHGQQVDLLITRQLPGAGSVRIAVECKYVSDGKVSNQTVHDFSAFVINAVGKRAISKGVLVTNASFTVNAKAAAGDYVELLSIKGLENQLFALKEIYREVVAEYEGETIFREYITLSAKSDSDGSSIANALFWAMDFVAAKKSPPPSLVVLADYGSGKTTLLRRLFHDAAIRFSSGASDLKPLYLELKYMNDHDSVDAFISLTLRRQMSFDMPMPLFWRELRRGGFLMLLDGFDEMSPQVDRSVRIKNFFQIGPLFRGGSPSVLTCRPSYFVNDQEYRSALSEIRKNASELGLQIEQSSSNQIDTIRDRVNELYLTLHDKYTTSYLSGEEYTARRYGVKGLRTIRLEPFSERQVKDYLYQFNDEFMRACERKSGDIYNFLLGIYDLTELMQKPILLSMIKDTILLKGKEFFDTSGDFGPATLYELYTNLNFDIDWAKGYSRRFLTREERRNFAQALAVAMYENSKLEVTYDEIIAIVGRHQRIMSGLSARFASVNPEQVASDIQVCTFITRTPSEGFRFIHKSYMEFFVASFLNGRLSSKMLSAKLLPKEIVYFLSSFSRLGGPIAEHIKFHLKRIDQATELPMTEEKVTFRSNIFRIFLNSLDEITNRSFQKANLDEIDLKKLIFGRTLFTGTSFYGNRWERCGFNETRFIECEFDDCLFTNVVFRKVEMGGSVQDSRKEGCRVEHSHFNLACNRFEIADTKLTKSKLTLRGSIYFKKANIQDSEIVITTSDQHQQSLVEFADSEIDRVGIIVKPRGKQIPQVSLSNCQFKALALFGPAIDIESLENILSHDVDCSGFAFVKIPPLHERAGLALAAEINTLEKTGTYWPTKRFATIHLDRFKQRKDFIPDAATQAVAALGLSTDRIEELVQFWTRWKTDQTK